ncbi:MAG: putative FAD-linked oxidoreductase [Candidatus Heimdallarchaeota archaeon LC_3]|nr:MAG: putative FAD-linked oxidoreductase [Candidatus Heimdallarchaeota archaeon LC_3]
MKKDIINYEELNSLFHWGGEKIWLTDQMSEFIKDYFSITNLERKMKENINREKSQFPIMVPESKISDNLFKQIKNIPDLKISIDKVERIKFSFGMSYWDLLRLRNGKVKNIIDAVVFPNNVEALKEFLKIANDNDLCVIPSGGRTSVTEAIEPILKNKTNIAINMSLMNKILEFFPDSSIALVESGIILPDLEKWLNERNYKFGHSPQSFLLTSIGGAISAKGAGQFSSLYGNIKNLILDMEVITPIGSITNRNLLVPESAVGPNITDLMIGSEGSLGIISKAYLRIRPIMKLNFSSFLFKTFFDGINAIKEFYQLGLKPSVIRLSDKEETKLFLRLASNTEEGMIETIFKEATSFYLKRKGFITDHQCLLVLVFDGIEEINKVQKSKISAICKSNQGISIGESPAKSWYKERYQFPFYRSNFMEHGLLVDTLETATIWSNLPIIYEKVISELKQYCLVAMSHISHIYNEGAAIYFTFLTEEDYDWDNPLIKKIRKAILEIFNKNGATLSHHHGVGNAFKESLHLEKNLLSFKLLKEIKESLDPNNILNPSSGLFRPNISEKNF